VVVTNSTWDFLGEHDRRKAFAQMALASFKAHWTQFHRWTGSDPVNHRVQVWAAGGLSLEKPVATISASGLYIE
jgi:hypothetical protein